MSEPETPLDPALLAQRARVADRIERRLKWMLPLSLFYAPITAAIGVSDLVFGWLHVSRGLDAVFIFAGASGSYSTLHLRRTVRRLRSVKTRRSTTKSQIARAVTSILGMWVFIFAVGYLVGGWVLGSVVVGVWVALSVALMLRARAAIRRRQLG